jgi:hypothetical protein
MEKLLRRAACTLPPDCNFFLSDWLLLGNIGLIVNCKYRNELPNHINVSVTSITDGNGETVAHDVYVEINRPDSQLKPVVHIRVEQDDDVLDELIEHVEGKIGELFKRLGGRPNFGYPPFWTSSLWLNE